MSRLDALVSLSQVKRAIVDAILDALTDVPGIRSITFVGSFVDREDLSGISDIDTVVVFDRLTPARFAEAVAQVRALSGEAVGCPGRQLLVNATLGPLKYDGLDQVVVHLMLYDLASHRQHVIKSPFTCLDWERSQVGWGVLLADVYPVGCLEPRDFLAARRGLTNYVSDLESGTLSFRRFEPQADRMVEVEDRVVLDRRHQGEYAYHIVRNLVANTLKLLSGQNRLWDEPSFLVVWREQLPEMVEWISFYECLRDLKLARADDFPADTLARTRIFLGAFSAALDDVINRAFKLRFVRHGRTLLNDGTFLGRGRDPALVEPQSIARLDQQWDSVHSSPMRRAVETAKALAPQSSIHVDERLAEIDYGHAEGHNLASLREHFPQVVWAWDRGEDSPFPGGEGNEDVLRRARSYLESFALAAGSGLAVTHNVVLRVIVAHLLGLDLRQAYRIPIAHLEALDICRIGGRWLPNWGATVKAQLIDGFVGWQDRE